MERITNVELEGFRGVRAGSVAGLVDVNVLVGRNNSGKSTVVEAILRVAESFSAGKGDVNGRSRIHRLGELRSEPSWHPGLLYRREAPHAALVVSTTDAQPLRLTYSAGGSKLGVMPTFTCCALGATCFWPSDARNLDIERALWDETLRARRDKTLAKHISTIFGMEVEAVQLPPDGRAMLLFSDHGLPLDSQGDGARAAFRALTLLSALKNTVLILEEPECHQHPGSLERFARAVTKLASENSVQLILTTHSSECIRAFLAAAADVGSASAVFHLALQDGALDARKLDGATVATLTETGTDVRFLSLYA